MIKNLRRWSCEKIFSDNESIFKGFFDVSNGI
jgi:hypothetical protein